MLLGYLLLIRQQAHMGAIVEKNTDCVVRQLVTKSIFVGVVHPFSHPLKTAVQAFFWNVISCNDKKNTKNQEWTPVYLWDNAKTWAAETYVKSTTAYLLACSPDSLGVLWPQCLLQFPSCYPLSLPPNTTEKAISHHITASINIWLTKKTASRRIMMQ